MAAPFPDANGYQVYTGVTLDNADFARVDLLLDLVAGMIRSYTGQRFDAVINDVVTVDASSSARLYLPELPVTGVVSVDIDGSALVAVDDYSWTADGVLTRTGCAWWGSWWTCAPKVTVTYSHGYVEVPADIRAVCFAAVRRLWDQSVLSGVASESIGTYSVSYSQTTNGQGSGLFFGDVERYVLDRYRLPSVA